MRNKIFGGIGILWGGSLVFRWIFSSPQNSGSSAYQAGQSSAVIFGLIMLLAGLYYFFKKSSE
jgi:LPXTG-motif cell wall-anchored protein